MASDSSPHLPLGRCKRIVAKRVFKEGHLRPGVTVSQKKKKYRWGYLLAAFKGRGQVSCFFSWSHTPPPQIQVCTTLRTILSFPSFTLQLVDLFFFSMVALRSAYLTLAALLLFGSAIAYPHPGQESSRIPTVSQAHHRAGGLTCMFTLAHAYYM